MNIRHLLIALCLLVPIIAEAGNTRPGNYSTKEYWVLGSFVMKNRAIAEAKRIQDDTGFEVKLLPANVQGRPHFQVVVELSATAAERDLQKTAFADAGVVGAWRLHPHVLDDFLIAINGEGAKPAPAVAAMPAKPASVAAAPSAEDIAAMQMKESYLDFCMNKANLSQRKQYCNNQGFAANARNKSDVTPEYRAFVEFCTSKANLAQRQSMCNNKGFKNKSSTAG